MGHMEQLQAALNNPHADEVVVTKSNHQFQEIQDELTGKGYGFFEQRPGLYVFNDGSHPPVKVQKDYIPGRHPENI